MNNIFTTLLYQMEKHHDTVLCTIIADNGSTPRGRGAQMLVGQAGLLCGTIGGGAVEGQTINMSKKLLQERRSAVHEYRAPPEQGGGYRHGLRRRCDGAPAIHRRRRPRVENAGGRRAAPRSTAAAGAG